MLENYGNIDGIKGFKHTTEEFYVLLVQGVWVCSNILPSNYNLYIISDSILVPVNQG